MATRYDKRERIYQGSEPPVAWLRTRCLRTLADMLLGRDHEQLTLLRLLQDARACRSGVVAIVGEAGIGKSALLAYAEEQAGGMNVLRARGVQSEAHIPFAGLFELLRPALPLIDQIPGPQAAALESALALRPAGAQARFAVGAATLSLLACYSDAAPLAVLVDDAHWLDGSSADALLFAFRRLIADPVAAILTVARGSRRCSTVLTWRPCGCRAWTGPRPLSCFGARESSR